MFSQLSLKMKMLLSFSAVAAIGLVIGMVGLTGINRISALAEDVVANALPSIQAMGIIQNAKTEVDSAENALLSTELKGIDRKNTFARFEVAKQTADAAMKQYEPLVSGAEETGLWRDFTSAWNAWWDGHQTYVKLVHDYDA
ncbi:MAG: hypothetical protein HGA76_02700, partial [Candidatus Firestonebacteria bacterium]|nr:hypothetical protein [Candidatus Firestonebacteria bacterium]